MSDIVEELSKLSNAEFDTYFENVRKDANALWEMSRSRPSSLELAWLRMTPDHLKAAQNEWDASHPGVAASHAVAQAKYDAAREERDRRIVVKERRQRALSVLDEVPRLRVVVEKGLDDTKAWDAIREWARTESWCLLLLGGVGCGKSTAAAAHAVDVAMTRGGLPVWIRAVRASRMSGFGEDTEQCLEAWRGARLLVIDDLGAEVMTATWQQMLEDVLDYRYQHSLRTMLPSNLGADEFKSRYGERIADRIRHEGTVRTLDAKSMRRGGR